MATSEDVKKYLGHWFQLGKKVYLHRRQTALLPQPVIQGDRYSSDFETCWQQILSDADSAYLEATEQTVAELMSDRWEIVDCARCEMPVPIQSLGMPPASCPCTDLPTWPNLELPLPRSPVNSQSRLYALRERLNDT